MGELIAVRRRLALFFGLFVFVIALLTTQARSPDRRQVGAIGTTVLTVLVPVQTGMARVADGVQRMWNLYTEIGRLRVENAKLQEALDGMGRRNAALQEQALAGERLERLLGFPWPGREPVDRCQRNRTRRWEVVWDGAGGSRDPRWGPAERAGGHL